MHADGTRRDATHLISKTFSNLTIFRISSAASPAATGSADAMLGRVMFTSEPIDRETVWRMKVLSAIQLEQWQGFHGWGIGMCLVHEVGSLV